MLHCVAKLSNNGDRVTKLFIIVSFELVVYFSDIYIENNTTKRA